MNILGNMALNALPQGLVLLKNALSRSQQPTQTAQQPTTPVATQPSTADMIKQQYDQALASRTATINKARDESINGYNQQIQGADGQYQPLRNDASYQGSKSLQGLKETMAQQGLFNSGDNLTGQMNINNNTASNINSLNTQQQDYINKLNQSIAQARANADADIASATADTTSQKLNALVNQANADRTFDYQKGRDTISDNRYNTEYADSRADRANDVAFRDKQYTDTRSDAKYNRDMAAKQYRDSENWKQREYRLDAPIKQLQAQQLAQAIALAKQNALKNSSGGGRSSGGRRSSGRSRGRSGNSDNGNYSNTDYKNSNQRTMHDYANSNVANYKKFKALSGAANDPEMRSSDRKYAAEQLRAVLDGRWYQGRKR